MRTGFDVEMSEGKVTGRLFRAAPVSSPRGGLVCRAVDPQSKRFCLLVGRLYYRSDLRAAVPGLVGRAFSSDAALALAVFQALGPRGLARLEGDFSLIVADTAVGCLYALRDPLGSWPLYWASSAGRLVVGTSLLDLARRLGKARVSSDHLATYLTWPYSGIEMCREETALEPFRRVPAGRLLRLAESRGPVTLHDHAWPAAGDEGTIDEDTAGQRFLNILRMAIGERLGPESTAAHLSGGMDSSAVVCLARDLIRDRGEVQPLHTLSLVYGLPSLAGETPYIRQVLDQGGPVIQHDVDGDQLLGFDWFSPSGIPEHDEPCRGLPQIAAEIRLTQVADEIGASTILTGAGAELVAEGQGLLLADLIRRGRWVAAGRETWSQALGVKGNLWPVLLEQGLMPLIPGRLRGGLGASLRRGRDRWPKLSRYGIPPWVRTRFASKHDLWGRGAESTGLFYQAPFEETASRAGISCLTGDWSAWHMAAPRGLQISRPFLDPRLISFSLSLPYSLRIKPGVAKPVLQSSMKGILPEPIRTRLWKRHFNDPYRLGLTRRLGAVEAMVQRSSIDELDIFDRGSLLDAIRCVAAGLGDMSGGFHINNAVSLIAWHDQLGPLLARPADEPNEVVQSDGKLESGRCLHVSRA
jgi:asparagine synthase (glutamine-hydrolysing)